MTITISFPILVAIIAFGISVAVFGSIAVRHQKLWKNHGGGDPAAYVICAFACVLVTLMAWGITSDLSANIEESRQVAAREAELEKKAAILREQDEKEQQIQDEVWNEFQSMRQDIVIAMMDNLDPEWQTVRRLLTNPKIPYVAKVEAVAATMPNPQNKISVNQYSELINSKRRRKVERSDSLSNKLAVLFAPYIDINKSDPLAEFDERGGEIREELAAKRRQSESEAQVAIKD